MSRTFLAFALSLALATPAWACPTDLRPRSASDLLSVQVPGAPALVLKAGDLAALPPASLTQRLSVSAGASSATERSLVYSGVLLRDLLLKAGFGGPTDRAARTGVIEVVATDGYRAVFSWGEVFNAGLGDQLIVILAQDGKALDTAAGPLALRSLGDFRPGPRHVRNLCAVLVRGLP